MTKTGFRSGTQTPFSTELERLVSGTGLTQQAFMDELSSQLGEVLTLSRFNGWIRGRYAPPPALQDRVLLAARAVAAEAARYPRPIPDVPAEVVQAKLAEWQKNAHPETDFGNYWIAVYYVEFLACRQTPPGSVQQMATGFAADGFMARKQRRNRLDHARRPGFFARTGGGQRLRSRADGWRKPYKRNIVFIPSTPTPVCW
jgi:hypothetical protein